MRSLDLCGHEAASICEIWLGCMRRNKLKLYCVFFSHLLFTLETHFADAKHLDYESLAFGLKKIDLKDT